MLVIRYCFDRMLTLTQLSVSTSRTTQIPRWVGFPLISLINLNYFVEHILYYTVYYMYTFLLRHVYYNS